MWAGIEAETLIFTYDSVAQELQFLEDPLCDLGLQDFYCNMMWLLNKPKIRYNNFNWGNSI